MVERKRGVVINVSSIAGVISTLNLTLYSATKAFNDRFSQNLSAEYEKDGIIIQTILPGLVSTNMTSNVESSLTSPTAKDFVDACMTKIGFAKRTNGYLPHSAVQFLGQLVYFLAPSVYHTIQTKFAKSVRDRDIANGTYKPTKQQWRKCFFSKFW